MREKIKLVSRIKLLQYVILCQYGGDNNSTCRIFENQAGLAYFACINDYIATCTLYFLNEDNVLSCCLSLMTAYHAGMISISFSDI